VSHPSLLLLSAEVVSRLATPADYLECMRGAFADMAAGRFEMPNVGHLPGIDGGFHIKAACRTGHPALAAIKVNGNFPQNRARYGLPTIQGFLALLDAERGSVLALMDSIEVTARRTAAATALAAQQLANPAAHTLGIVGCGAQAQHHLDALIEIAPITSVLFCDPSDAAARAFEAQILDRGLLARRVAEAAQVCSGAQIVVTLTTSTRPILRLADVAPGTFVAGVGADNPLKHELAADLLRASRVVVDSRQQAASMGDLHHAIAAGVMSLDDVHGELADLVTGRLAGRADAAERCVFDSTGLGFQDLAAAAMLYERARAAPGIQRPY
jgi:ornithine cyclodeaminase/alanine dehydrogenase-like protein (mu-crystallin family)